MSLLKLTPQRESRLKMALSQEKVALAYQVIDVLQQNPIGVHITFSQLIELCAQFSNIGQCVEYLTKNKKAFSLDGVGRLFAQELKSAELVSEAYRNARALMVEHNKRHKVSLETIISGIEHTPVCWDFEGFVGQQITWLTADNVILQGKNFGKYLARLKLPEWTWRLYAKKEFDGPQHPHVASEGYPCYGNAAGLMTAEKGIQKNLEGLWAFLHQYNEGSAYRRISAF